MLHSAYALYDSLKARDGRFGGVFACVRTTGIFCRMTCPARTPLRRNVEFRETVASCEAAGFRACKRCRPDQAESDRAESDRAGSDQAGSPMAGRSSLTVS